MAISCQESTDVRSISAVHLHVFSITSKTGTLHLSCISVKECLKCGTLLLLVIVQISKIASLNMFTLPNLLMTPKVVADRYSL